MLKKKEKREKTVAKISQKKRGVMPPAFLAEEKKAPNSAEDKGVKITFEKEKKRGRGFVNEGREPVPPVESQEVAISLRPPGGVGEKRR